MIGPAALSLLICVSLQARRPTPREQQIEPPRLIEEIEAELQNAPAEEPPPEEPVNVALPAESGAVGNFEDYALQSDPLQIGARLYLRGVVNGLYREQPSASCCRPRQLGGDVSIPLLTDIYFDGRPSDRVRAMFVGRLEYNPLPERAGTGVFGTGGMAAAQLEQMWLNMDLGRRLFVTIGRQHVRWGVSRFWNPTDFLASDLKDPSAIFDQRVGSDLLKLHLSWPETGINLYSVALVDVKGPPADPLRPGMAFRGEWAFGSAEIGLSAVFQEQVKPRYGADLSVGLGPVDIHGEVAYHRGSDRVHWRVAPRPTPSMGYTGLFEAFRVNTPHLAAAGGIILPLKLGTETTWTIGAEGFYQELGYEDPRVLPYLLLEGGFRSFYFGKYYAAAFTSYELADMLERRVAVSVFSNLLSRSYLSRLDISFRPVRSLRVELFGEYPFGERGTEFRMDFDVPAQLLADGTGTEPLLVPLSVFRVGLGLLLEF